MAELNEHHQAALHNYLRFARYLRTQRLRAVDACFEDVQHSRLLEDTYTCEEVIEVLKGLADVVRADVESELINMAHSNAVLLQNVFLQAEKWHLKLNADTNDLEHRELLEKMKVFEDDKLTRQSSESSRKSVTSPTKCRLEPLNEAGGVKLLQEEIDRLQEDNMKLREKLKMLESKTTGLLSDSSKLSAELVKTKDSIRTTLSDQEEQYGQEMTELHRQLSLTQQALSELEVSSAKQLDLEGSLTQMKHQLLQTKDQLERAEKEMEKKTCEAPAYLNLKKMLVQKNDTIKMLRKKLNKYEPQSTESNED